MIKNKEAIKEQKEKLIGQLVQERGFIYDGEIRDEYMTELLFSVYPYKYMDDELVIHHAFRSKRNKPFVVRQIIQPSPQDKIT
jgi:hypothetical protein